MADMAPDMASQLPPLDSGGVRAPRRRCRSNKAIMHDRDCDL